MILLTLFLYLQNAKVECYSQLHFDSTAVSKDIIVISTLCNELYIFDISLNLVKKIELPEYTRVFTFKNSVMAFDYNHKTDSFIITKEAKILPIESFAPIWLASDGNTKVFFPSYSPKPLFKNGEQEIKWNKNTKNLQRFDYYDKEIILKGDRFLKVTPSQYRSQLNWRGFWIFENQNNGLDIITQKDPIIFNDENNSSKPIDIPNFIYRTDLLPLSERIFTLTEHYLFLEDFHINSSIILGVYRFNCGFVICYADHTAQQVTFSRLAFYDENWDRYGQVQIIPGKLIGVNHEKGFMLTFTDETMVSELSIIELLP